jgi:predicted NodU family carbamoyl transferase
VQTVGPEGALAPLLAALPRHGAPPVVVNTSLNLAGEPIVAGAVDALALFARRPIDALLVAHFARGQKLLLVPLLVVLLLGGVLLAATGGLAYVAPFVYTLF